VYASDAESWIDQELAQQPVFVQIARSVTELVCALVDDPPPRPQFLVADFDAMNAGELLHLHAIREQGWFGSIVALGTVPLSLRTSMGIERVISRPYPRHALRSIVAQSGQEMSNTMRISKVSG
jgi:hypothetical protein